MSEPTPIAYTVRNGPYKGRNLRELSAQELTEMVRAIPKDEDATAGIGMMLWILKNYPPATFVDFVEWGQNILDETGKITPADFSADPHEVPNTPDEHEMLRHARPELMTRRNLLLGVPSAAVSLFTVTRLTLAALKQAQEPKPEEGAAEESKTRIGRLSDRFEELSNLPVEMFGLATLLFEIVEMIKDYEPQKFDEISNGVAKIADDMGIGDPTPTFRLPPRARSSEGRGRA